jgi:hypothetical protein
MAARINTMVILKLAATGYLPGFCLLVFCFGGGHGKKSGKKSGKKKKVATGRKAGRKKGLKQLNGYGMCNHLKIELSENLVSWSILVHF